jgi:hypothetical protein
MPSSDRDIHLLHAKFHETENYIFSVCENGKVTRTDKRTLKEKRVHVFVHKGRAHITAYRTMFILPQLVAKYFLPGFRPGDTAKCMDGNPLNCGVGNLWLVDRKELRSVDGHSRNKLSKTVVCDGVEYPSVRNLAKRLHATEATVWNYIKGRYKKSYLEGHDIRLKEAAS